MKRIVTEFKGARRLFFVFVLLISLTSILFAQAIEQRKQAKKAIDDGKKLGSQETLETQKNALKKFKTATRLYQELGDKNGEGKASLESGIILQKLGKREEALKSYNRAYNLFQRTENKLLQAKTVNFIGTVYSSLGQKKKAFDLYNLALRIFYQIDAFHEAIPTINNIGVIYQEFGDPKNALFYFNLALPHVREAGDKGSEAMILLNIGDVYADANEQSKAIAYFNDSLSLQQSAGNLNGEVRTLNQLGVSNFKLDKKQDAINFVNRALTINGSRFKISEALSLSYLMNAHKSLGRPKLAAFYGKQAVNKYQDLRKGIQNLDTKIQSTYLKTVENTYRQLAGLLISDGQFAQSERVLQMLKEEEFSHFVKRDLDEIRSLEKRVELNETERKLIARYSALATEVTVLGRRFTELDTKKRKLSRSNKNLTGIDKSRYERLSSQISDANAAFKLFLDKQLIRELGQNTVKEIEYDRNLQAKLRKWGNGTVALYTVVTEDRYRVILTTPTVQVDGKTDIKAGELNKKIFAYRAALQDLSVDPRHLGKELYDILVKPIEKHLAAAGAKTLVWSLDGSLRYIPLATLSPDGKSFLVERYQNVIITPKTRDDVSDENSEWKALGVGVSEALSVENPANIKQKIKFTSLPGTVSELRAIVRNEGDPTEDGIFPGRRYLDRDFTMRSFSDSLTAENLAGSRKYTVVHIASHFRLGNNWTDSFLLLGDGKTLTLEQISNSPQITFGDVELVTLSACNTALGGNSNGKEVDSLAEAIQTKSGKAVLATLWAVADESTSILMSDFYRSRKDDPMMTKALSIQKSQRAMIDGELKPSAAYTEKLAKHFKGTGENAFVFDEAKPFEHPYFWSPFVLIGNWR
ncbi:MAG: CHAT domain-containing protein [Pyrinomonadaceae bacterium]|nr:CHAT domain-containing protein [Pyrinomonadaceae bacterium]